MKAPTSRRGSPRPGGRLERYLAWQDNRNLPVFEDGLVYVSVEGHHPRKAVIGAGIFEALTGGDPHGPMLTRTRWFLDDQNMLRAFSRRESPMTHGVLVAAAVLGAEEGDCIEIPADPFDVRMSQLRRVS